MMGVADIENSDDDQLDLNELAPDSQWEDVDSPTFTAETALRIRLQQFEESSRGL